MRLANWICKAKKATFRQCVTIIFRNKQLLDALRACGIKYWKKINVNNWLSNGSACVTIFDVPENRKAV